MSIVVGKTKLDHMREMLDNALYIATNDVAHNSIQDTQEVCGLRWKQGLLDDYMRSPAIKMQLA